MDAEYPSRIHDLTTRLKKESRTLLHDCNQSTVGCHAAWISRALITGIFLISHCDIDLTDVGIVSVQSLLSFASIVLPGTAAPQKFVTLLQDSIRTRRLGPLLGYHISLLSSCTLAILDKASERVRQRTGIGEELGRTVCGITGCCAKLECRAFEQKRAQKGADRLYVVGNLSITNDRFREG